MKSLRKFSHIDAASVGEAVSMLKKRADKACVLAGGTDLLGTLRFEIFRNYPETIVNLKTIPGLDYIKEEDNLVRIGALTRLQDIANSPIIKSKLAALAEAAHSAASPHIREMGTIGGNICQLNRCWYFRKEGNRFDCMRKGGQTCFAIVGENRYHSIFGAVKAAVPACSSECPGNVDIPSYFEKIRDNDLLEAAKILLKSNPFPAITGRVCPHKCEQGCNRGEFDEAISIRSVERSMGDYILENHARIIKPPEKETGKKVAIVGSGPAGLVAAYYLRMSGYHVTVFDRNKKPGGMLSYAIPLYRLPDDIVQKQIKVLESIGVEFRVGTDVGKDISVEDLKKSFNSVFLACGVQNQSVLKINDEELLVSGLEFLRNARLGTANVPARILVIGGGNVAIDVATVALRLGAKEVIAASLESREEMPAFEAEIETAVAEGVQLMPSWGPSRVIVENGKVTGMELVRCTSVYDKEHHFSPVFDDNTKKTVNADQIILAIGQRADLSFISPKLSLTTNRGLLVIAPETQATNIPGVFAGGDITTGSASVIEAITAGRKAADFIDLYLKGKRTKHTEKETGSTDLALKFNVSSLKKTNRVKNPEIPIPERMKSLEAEDIGSLDLKAALTEANRCFNCGCFAVNSSDLAPALIVLDAKIVTSKRTIKADEFWAAGKGVQSTILQNDEIVIEIQLPKLGAGTKCAFVKFALRKSIDFPIVNCAAAIGGKTAKICLNAVYNKPFRATKAEDFIKGKTINETNAEAAGAAAVSDAIGLNYNRYKIQIAKTMVKRAILTCQ
ncbi:MAG: FAD binding domain-containing protein [Dehalococcoidales bacterium]|jgi:NADPH-dependent glutamate synthase beta subunit-like oxidoreductase